jgi:transcription elongation factor Elf1
MDIKPLPSCVKGIHDETFPCPWCGKEHTSPLRFKTKDRNVTKRHVVCDRCGKPFIVRKQRGLPSFSILGIRTEPDKKYMRDKGLDE